MSLRPRYMVWENVDGVRSSGSTKGADFAIVLEEIIKVCEPEAVHIHVGIPDGGWPPAGCYYAEDGSWTVAYRTVDAQFFGTPQRRRRLALLADFNGTTAPVILFDPQLQRETETEQPYEAEPGTGGQPAGTIQTLSQGLQGHSQPGGTEGEDTSAGTESRAGSTGIFGIDLQGGKGGANYTWGIAPTIASDSHGTPHAVSFQERAGKPGGGKGILIQDEHTGAIGTQNVQSVIAFKRGSGAKARTIGAAEEPAPTLAEAESGTNQVPAISYSIQGNTIDRDAKQNGLGIDAEVSHTLNSTDRHGVMAFTQNQREEVRDLGDLAGSISAETGSHQQNYVMDNRVSIPIEGSGKTERVFDARGNGKGEISPTITGDHQNRITDYTAIVLLSEGTEDSHAEKDC